MPTIYHIDSSDPNALPIWDECYVPRREVRKRVASYNSAAQFPFKYEWLEIDYTKQQFND